MMAMEKEARSEIDSLSVHATKDRAKATKYDAVERLFESHGHTNRSGGCGKN
jgi:hypothetical protein